MKKRRTFSPEEKSKIALEAIRENTTISELAQKHQVHPNQIRDWKKQAIANMSKVFDKGKEQENELIKLKQGEKKLFQHIGQLKVEVDFLKSSCEKLGIPLPKEYYDC